MPTIYNPLGFCPACGEPRLSMNVSASRAHDAPIFRCRACRRAGEIRGFA